ncbi:MAG: tetratricopeptide repeat protein [Candidatus Lactobacillus pullistercoris]|uniref:Tetratricopeptide repeat protein n=1 Tax=Candidatus Lactobacillus pullistercoris TaxID=2838636 RepID=A0A9E2KS72_9LACO|nr:tetratricopeptide repeat protein [Candidatus Lactobacillus pullistercoris]
MVSVSQENLLKLALEDENKGNYDLAIQNLEEALSYDPSNKVVIKLCKLYRKNKQEDQAYALIKDQPDLFSDEKIFNEYCQILKANHYFIEFCQLEKLLDRKIKINISPVSESEQNKIMTGFRKKEQITQLDYQSLLKLNLINFENFSQSLLLDPSQNFAVRLALCEDLVRLNLEKTFKVWILGKQKEFIPNNTPLLEKSTVYTEVIGGIGDHFRNNPSQLPIMLGETNLILGSLYPEIGDYIRNTDGFTSDLISYIQTGNGRTNQKLLEKIYKYLPK